MEHKFVENFLEHYGSDPALDSDYLQHWKYIKRERINGKWRYWYDEGDNKLSSLQKKQAELQTKYDKDFEEFWKNRRNEDLKSAKNRIEEQNVKRWYSDPDIKKHTKNAYGMVNGEGYSEKRELDKVARDIRSHGETASGKVDKFMQKNGANAAAKLNEVSAAINKGKSWVDNLFKKKK